MLIRLRKELEEAYIEIARLEHALCASNLLAARAKPEIVHMPPEMCHVIDLKHDLTERERDVLVWLMAGDGNEEIAKRLYLSPSTVKCHLVNVYHKLNVHNRNGAAMAGVALGFKPGNEDDYAQ